MADETMASTPTAPPEEYMIDERLVDKWFEIPDTESIEIEIPRATFDMLYIAIEKAYQALTDTLRSTHAPTPELRSVAVDSAIANIYKGMNSLKQFQTVIMANATNTPLDGNGRVKEAGGDDI